ncbi:MAG: hydroxypyruvate isomerase family protein [Cyclobacteriaceae bacterium]
MSQNITRKKALKSLAAGTALVASAGYTLANPRENEAVPAPLGLAGNINHSVCQWCYNKLPLEELAERAQDIGMKSIELVQSKDWPILEKYGLTCALAYGSDLSLNSGFSHPEQHERLLKDFSINIPKAVDFGLKTVICFSGNRNGISDEQGLENCAQGLEPVVKLAEKYNITISMELLNSKVNHPDYQCDHTEWGVALVDKVGSPNFKLLYDIYHMQIMEGDIIATIRKYKDYIAHYHTGGVPGRNEIDDTQELQYATIMNAILETGYTGFVGQEFIPKGPDPLAALEAGVKICDV